MKIVVLDAQTIADVSSLVELENFGEVTYYQLTKAEETVERIQEADIVITNKVILNESVLSQSPSVQLICITATGTNNVDFDYCNKKGIVVKNVAGYGTESVAQHTFAMLFHLISQLGYYDQFVKSGEYSQQQAFTHFKNSFWEIKGKIFGIIGLGAIGRRVAELAQAFGCRVIYFSTSGKNTDSTYERVELKTLLSESDIISIHAPLNENTQNLINKDTLNLCKSSVLLLNTGRGGIINESDLANALNNNQLGGAGLDVFEKEPIAKSNPLLSLKESHKLVVSPHNAWTSVQARATLIQETVENIKTFIKEKSSR